MWLLPSGIIQSNELFVLILVLNEGIFPTKINNIFLQDENISFQSDFINIFLTYTLMQTYLLQNSRNTKRL